MNEANPYQPGSVTSQGSPKTSYFNRHFAILTMGVFVTLLNSFIVLATWLAAAIHLGRLPREMLDDPKHIGGDFDYVYGWSCYLLFELLPSAPIIWLIGFTLFLSCQWTFGERTVLKFVQQIGLYLVLCVVLFVVVQVVAGFWFDD